MIKLLVDSSSDFTPAELAEAGIEFVPISIEINGHSYKDGLELSKNDLYRMLEDGADFPKTSLPSPHDFLSVFEEAKASGDCVICILLSSALSGTYQSAVTAKAMAEYDNIYIIDSLSVSYGIQFLVKKALALISEGFDCSYIVSVLEALKKRIRIAASLDTLEFLYKGGRLSRTSAAIGSLVNLKPIVTVSEDGTVAVIQKCLGKNKAVSYLNCYLEKHPADPEYPIFSIYTYGTENCEAVESFLTEKGENFSSKAQIGPTIGAHVGPGAAGLIYIENIPT